MVSRGDVVIVSAQGDYGKPRPAVVVQSDAFNPTHAGVLVCLVSSDLQHAPLFRLDVPANEENGLRVPSQIMVDKIVAIKRERIALRAGRIDDGKMMRLNRSLALFIGVGQ